MFGRSVASPSVCQCVACSEPHWWGVISFCVPRRIHIAMGFCLFGGVGTARQKNLRTLSFLAAATTMWPSICWCNTFMHSCLVTSPRLMNKLFSWHILQKTADKKLPCSCWSCVVPFFPFFLETSSSLSTPCLAVPNPIPKWEQSPRFVVAILPLSCHCACCVLDTRARHGLF